VPQDAAVVHQDDSRQTRLTVLRSLQLFSPLPEPRLEALADALIRLSFPAGAVIVADGDDPDYFYVVVAGEVDVTRGGRHSGSHGPGDHFGEAALLHGVRDELTAVAHTPALLYALDATAFADAVASTRQSWETASALIAERRHFAASDAEPLPRPASSRPSPRRRDAPCARSSEGQP
jgi:CRP-like cAMP-binding protein